MLIWLKSSFLILRKHKHLRFVIVPWGRHSKNIRNNLPQEFHICEPSQDTTLESNRNKALKYLSANPPKLVAFLDDDTFLAPSWGDAMIAAAQTNADIDAFASVVFSEGWSEMQGQGHVFVRGGPRDRGYHGRELTRPVLCPCGNSAVIRWQALKRIWDVGDQVWDPLFNQDQTCFDFGLKLILTNTRTMVVPGAVAQHRGYLSPKIGFNKEDRRNKVIRQLTSRYLLYKKFLPDELHKAAVTALNLRLPKWRSQGYPGFNELVKGDEVDILNECAKNKADAFANSIECRKWSTMMSKLKCSWELLDLKNEGTTTSNNSL